MLISQLPEPYKSMALANQVLQGSFPNKYLELSAARGEGGFVWTQSREGQGFWLKIENGHSPELTPEIKANYPDIFTPELHSVNQQGEGSLGYKYGIDTTPDVCIPLRKDEAALEEKEEISFNEEDMQNAFCASSDWGDFWQWLELYKKSRPNKP